jgi:hypothetical protein
MVRKTMQWILITALLLAVTWRPSANFQVLLHFLVCTGAIMVVLASFSIKHRVETHYAVDKSCSMQQDTPELGGGYTWWVALFFKCIIQ